MRSFELDVLEGQESLVLGKHGLESLDMPSLMGDALVECENLIILASGGGEQVISALLG